MAPPTHAPWLPSVSWPARPPPATCPVQAHEFQCLFGLTNMEMETKVASAEAALENWCSHPVYTRYWYYYHQAMAWMHSHQSAYHKAVQAYFSSLWYFHPCNTPQEPGYTSGGPTEASQDAYCGSYEPWLADPQEEQGWGKEQGEEQREELGEAQDEEVSDCEGVECDVSNMEISDELRQFFEETERHREERRRQQELADERLKEYIYADHDLYYDMPRSTEAPSEQPGERRQAEMKRLYGASAAKIMAMEAAVQLSFDKHCDSKKPKYWPVIPLKF